MNKETLLRNIALVPDFSLLRMMNSASTLAAPREGGEDNPLRMCRRIKKELARRGYSADSLQEGYSGGREAGQLMARPRRKVLVA